jgi:hypothetical protein
MAEKAAHFCQLLTPFTTDCTDLADQRHQAAELTPERSVGQSTHEIDDVQDVAARIADPLFIDADNRAVQWVWRIRRCTGIARVADHAVVAAIPPALALLLGHGNIVL